MLASKKEFRSYAMSPFDDENLLALATDFSLEFLPSRAISLLYSCTPVLLYSCTPVLLYSCTPVLLYSCTPVLLYSCTPVLLYSCIHGMSAILIPCRAQ